MATAGRGGLRKIARLWCVATWVAERCGCVGKIRSLRASGQGPVPLCARVKFSTAPFPHEAAPLAMSSAPAPPRIYPQNQPVCPPASPGVWSFSGGVCWVLICVTRHPCAPPRKLSPGSTASVFSLCRSTPGCGEPLGYLPNPRPIGADRCVEFMGKAGSDAGP